MEEARKIIITDYYDITTIPGVQEKFRKFQTFLQAYFRLSAALVRIPSGILPKHLSYKLV